MKPIIVLVAALLVAAAVLLSMPMVAEALLPLIGGADGPSAAAAEVVYSGAIFLVLAAAGIIGARLSGGRALALGDAPGKQVALGLALGLGGLAAAVLHSKLAGSLSTAPVGVGLGALFLAGTLLVFVQVGAEEIFFRGWLQPVLVGAWGGVIGIGVSAAAFAALHLVGGAMQPLSLLNLFVGGILFGILARSGGGIAAALAAHFAWNWSEAMIFGLIPNPGEGSFGTIVNLELAGPHWWGGAAEGLNSSAGMTAALLALVLVAIAAGRRAPNRPYPAAG